MHLNGYSTFSQTRSPMKSRHFTKPPAQPQEDEVVESMNIVTVDMLANEDVQTRNVRGSDQAQAYC